MLLAGCTPQALMLMGLIQQHW